MGVAGLPNVGTVGNLTVDPPKFCMVGRVGKFGMRLGVETLPITWDEVVSMFGGAKKSWTRFKRLSEAVSGARYQRSIAIMPVQNGIKWNINDTGSLMCGWR